MITQSLNGVQFSLKEPFDFSFLRDYGEVFCVFDRNDSGNISFGVADGADRYFVKVAGARTVNSSSEPADAIAALRRAERVYRDLAHPSLIELVEARAVDGGYAAVFGWRDGECMHAHWTFDERPKRTHPDSPFYRFVNLPMGEQLDALRGMFEFQRHVSARGYVAIDFYDGSVMYDFARKAVTICDIDFYERMPYVNEMGRMWGSSRYMSPEEFEMGAVIDEVTNVYTMGATAFSFLGAERDRGIGGWRAGRGLHGVALRAVSEDRASRYQSIGEFIEAWQSACACEPVQKVQ